MNAVPARLLNDRSPDLIQSATADQLPSEVKADALRATARQMFAEVQHPRANKFQRSVSVAITYHVHVEHVQRFSPLITVGLRRCGATVEVREILHGGDYRRNSTETFLEFVMVRILLLILIRRPSDKVCPRMSITTL